MRIKQVHTHPITLPVRPEFVIVSSAGRHAVSRYVLVELRTDEGVSGWGEATVMPIWSGETQGGALAAINEILGPIVVGRNPSEFEEIAAQMDGVLVDKSLHEARHRDGAAGPDGKGGGQAGLPIAHRRRRRQPAAHSDQVQHRPARAGDRR